MEKELDRLADLSSARALSTKVSPVSKVKYSKERLNPMACLVFFSLKYSYLIEI